MAYGSHYVHDSERGATRCRRDTPQRQEPATGLFGGLQAIPDSRLGENMRRMHRIVLDLAA